MVKDIVNGIIPIYHGIPIVCTMVLDVSSMLGLMFYFLLFALALCTC